MQFFFPDSQDQVDPLFDFQTERHPSHRVRQRDDRYAHEMLTVPAYDGLLVSKAIVDGSPQRAGKYTMAQQQRLYRLGMRKFFRLDQGWAAGLVTMGDCGAFNYVEDSEPPYSVDDVIDFYAGIGVDRGVAVDHIVFGYLAPAQREAGVVPDPEWIRRQALTLELAAEFWARVKARKCGFEPVGVAHGWDPASYAESVKALQRMGYQRIAFGGMVPLKNPDILEVLSAACDVRGRGVEFHLLGVTRHEYVPVFQSYGVTSFDSTSPFRRAFKDETDNFYTTERRFTALRVPQVDAMLTIKRLISSGKVNQGDAMAAEKMALKTLRAFDRDEASVDAAVDALRSYEQIYDKRHDRSDRYRDTLTARPWRHCRCGVCDTAGIEVAIFRGSERNKRRGFHNLAIFRQELDAVGDAAVALAS